jgi:hypothetical protein
MYLHRLVMNNPEGFDVDHRSGRKLDNRKSELRVCDTSQNTCNRGAQSNNKSGFKGVFWSTWMNKWCSRIQLYQKNRHLGYFDTAEEAHAAYCEAAHSLHGEFARTA